MNQGADKPRAHPLKMMAADYDVNSRASNDDRNAVRSRVFTQHAKGGGKGRKGSRHHHANSASLDDFILPEMTQDPWIEIYSRLSEAVRVRETSHLNSSDRERIDSTVKFYPDAKRHNLD
jgi:hypothetical protein